ncbi:hypothetical protein ACFOWA_20055 [Pedobacter lithocola]|uniref:Helix-turn-helix domain-containing protein n=1 Tax=Pedobacter lithocola TaxID=1908239 RepID=A0ABV8PEN1_9SPHI
MEPVTFMDTTRLEKLEQSILNLENLVKQIAKANKIEDPLMTSLEVQEYLKKGGTWVDHNKHKIGCSRVGGEWRFRKSIVDAFVDKPFYKDE